MCQWGLWLWGSFMISVLELTPIILFSNRNNGEPNVNLHSSNDGDTNDAESGSFEFEFSSGFSPSDMSSADELFLNGQIRSMSPQRTAQFQWQEHEENEASHHHRILEFDDSENKEAETPSIDTTPLGSASSSRSSSSGRNSKKWIFFKDLLDEKEKNRKETETQKQKQKQKQKRSKQVLPKKPIAGKPVNGVEKRRVPPSAHELHYTANRAQAEEMKKKTFLPYRQGLVGCLGLCP
ncbi:hypothetical protein ACSBR2_017464 [Camellia fascicularis]